MRSGETRADEVDEREREIAGLELPSRMVGRQLLGRLQPPRLHRRTAGQPFEAVAVERARARERIRLEIVRDAHVPHLRVDEPVHQPAVHHAATADPRADGQVNERVESLRRAPAPLTERRGVDVGVDADFDAERVSDGAGDIHVRPPRLRCGGDESIRGGIRSQVERAE